MFQLESIRVVYGVSFTGSKEYGNRDISIELLLSQISFKGRKWVLKGYKRVYTGVRSCSSMFQNVPDQVLIPPDTFQKTAFRLELQIRANKQSKKLRSRTHSRKEGDSDEMTESTNRTVIFYRIFVII